MKKLSVFLIAACVASTVSAQDWLNTVFSKSLEYVTTINKKEWYKGQVSNKIKNNPRHGMGICKYADGTLYIGDFSNGIINGFGIQLATERQIIPNCDSCTIYSGNWKNGVKSGEGTCYNRYGDVIYFGNFENDMPIETYPSEEDFSLYSFSLIEYDNGDKYLGEIYEYSLNGYGIYIWANGDLWIGNLQDDQRNGIGIYLFYNAEWATISCKNDDCIQMTSSVEQRERDKSNKAVRAQVRQQNLALMAGALNEVATGISQVQSLTNSSSGSIASSNTGGSTNSSGGCNCAVLQDQYNRVKRNLEQDERIYYHSKGQENLGAVSGGTHGDNSASNAALKATAGRTTRSYQQQKSNLEQRASKCGCSLR